MIKEDKGLENLLCLNGERFVFDEDGLWVKFETKKVERTTDRPQGIRYSLTLHDRDNERMMGFDNAHAIEVGGKTNVRPKRVFDHWHRDQNDNGSLYEYVNAGMLVSDFWAEADKILKRLKGDKDE